jgi:hypothetical protein
MPPSSPSRKKSEQVEIIVPGTPHGLVTRATSMQETPDLKGFGASVLERLAPRP